MCFETVVEACLERVTWTPTNSRQPRGYHAGKKINCRKLHAMLDTDSRPLVLQAHQASVQVWMVAGPLPKASCRAVADSAYSGHARRLAHLHGHLDCSRVIPSTL